MGKALEDFGLQVASQVAGGGMGLILGKLNDQRQREQQQHLQDMQIRGQKEMTEYNRQKQMQMWRDTNYKAQMEQLKMAGLNPGLIYGMSGGGGVTAGVTGGNVSGGSAPQGGGEAQAMMGMGIQSALLGAQLRNIEAQTEKTKAETANVPLTGQQTQAQTGLTKVQTELANIEKEVRGRSVEATIRTIDAAGEKMIQEAEAGRYRNNVSEETWKTEVAQIRANLTSTLLKNALTEAQTASEKQSLTNAIKQLDLMNDELYKTNPERRRLISAQMQDIWDKIRQGYSEGNEKGKGVLDDIIRLIPLPSK